MGLIKWIGGGLFGTLASLLALALTLPRSPVLIESEESKNLEGHPVFNRIELISQPSRDVWKMQQSHHGLSSDQKWDELAIIVDKKNHEAKFFQYGRSFRASCFTCHANGPRAIRPNWNSSNVRVSFWDRMRITFWNFRIKSYGPLESSGENPSREVPFRLAGKLENDKLLVSSCVKCHNDSGLFARGYLRRQQALTIRHMTSAGHMPPLWFSLSDKDRKSLDRFLLGF